MTGLGEWRWDEFDGVFWPKGAREAHEHLAPDQMAVVVNALEVQLAAAAKRESELRAALAQYGRHLDFCDGIWAGDVYLKAWTCGLAQGEGKE